MCGEETPSLLNNDTISLQETENLTSLGDFSCFPCEGEH